MVSEGTFIIATQTAIPKCGTRTRHVLTQGSHNALRTSSVSENVDSSYSLVSNSGDALAIAQGVPKMKPIITPTAIEVVRAVRNKGLSSKDSRTSSHHSSHLNCCKGSAHRLSHKRHNSLHLSKLEGPCWPPAPGIDATGGIIGFWICYSSKQVMNVNGSPYVGDSLSDD